MLMVDYLALEEICRRKARRIKYSSNRLSHLRMDIEMSDSVEGSEKEYLLGRIDDIAMYLQNDDKKDNKFNRKW